MPAYAPTTLIVFESSHVASTYEWVTTPQLQHDFLLRGEITWEGHVEYFERLLADTTQSIYAIVYEGTHIGNCGFKHIDLTKGCAELWIYLGNYTHHGKGLGSNATRKLLVKGFSELSFDMIYLHVAEFNKKAVALYQRLGFALSPCNGCPGWDDRTTSIMHMDLPRKRWLKLDNSGDC